MSNHTQSPGRNPPNNVPLEVHPGRMLSGQDGAQGQKAYHINDSSRFSARITNKTAGTMREMKQTGFASGKTLRQKNS